MRSPNIDPRPVLSFALLLVAACSNREEQQRTADGDTPTVLASSGDAKVVHIYNWVDYIEPTLLEKFTAETASEPEIAWAKLAARRRRAAGVGGAVVDKIRP